MNPYPSFEVLENTQKELVGIRYDYWLNHTLFSFQWWLLLVIFIVPWIIWWKFVDKKRLMEILLQGITVAHLVFVLDAIGKESGLWGYEHNLEPLFNRFLPVDASALPVFYMLIYQYFPKWRLFIIVHVLFAGIFAFIFEPLAVWLDIYQPHHWKFIYSFPIYIFIPIFMKMFMEKIKGKERNFS